MVFWVGDACQVAYERWDTKLPSRTWLIVVYLLVASTLQPRTGWISKCKWVNRLIVRLNLYVVFLLSLLSMNHLWSIYTTEIRATRVIDFHRGLIYRHLKIAIDHWHFQMCVALDEMLISLSCYCKNSNEGALLKGTDKNILWRFLVKCRSLYSIRCYHLYVPILLKGRNMLVTQVYSYSRDWLWCHHCV